MRRLIVITLTLGVFILIGRLSETPPAWLLPYGPEQVHDDTEPSDPNSATPEPLLRMLHSGSGEGEVAMILLGTTITPAPIRTSATAELFGIAADASAPTNDESPVTSPAEISDPETDDDDPPPTPGVGFLVTKVVDGDTVEIEGGERVRYIGIDTPESTTEHECYGEEAKARNRELVDGKHVTLVADIEDRDKYGRLLRYVYLPHRQAGVDDQFVNLALAREGYATQLTIPPNVAHADEFRDAVARAREQGRGLWSGCPAGEQNESSRSTRSDYDESIPQADTHDCPADQPIKGNAQSMIYHVPGGDFYERTKPEACFTTEGDAEAAGYRKSKR